MKGLNRSGWCKNRLYPLLLCIIAKLSVLTLVPAATGATTSEQWASEVHLDSPSPQLHTTYPSLPILGLLWCHGMKWLWEPWCLHMHNQQIKRNEFHKDTRDQWKMGADGWIHVSPFCPPYKLHTRFWQDGAPVPHSIGQPNSVSWYCLSLGHYSTLPIPHSCSLEQSQPPKRIFLSQPLLWEKIQLNTNPEYLTQPMSKKYKTIMKTFSDMRWQEKERRRKEEREEE